MYNDNQDSSTFGKILLKTGLVKDSSQVNKVLIVLTIVFFALSLYFIRGHFTGNKTSQADDYKALQKAIREANSQDINL